MRATEQSVPAECFDRDTNRCTVTSVCRLKDVLAEAVEAFYATLDHYTLADLVANRKALVRVMFPAAARSPQGAG